MSRYSNHLFTVGTSNNSWSHLYDYIPKNSRVLDVGCSNGNFGEALIQLKGCEVVGVDLDKEDISIAKKKLTNAYVLDINNKAAVEKLGKFDVIIFADVLEHLIDPRETLRTIKPLLTNNGIVAFSIPNMAHMSVRFDLLRGEFQYKEIGLLDYTHLHFYDHKEVNSIFTDSGYKIEQINPVISEYPRAVINKKLKNIGLIASDKFVSQLKKTHGDIFQFIGFATPLHESKHHESKPVKYVMPQDEIMAFAHSILRENARLSREQEAIINENHRLNMRVQELENNLVGRINAVSKKIARKSINAGKRVVKRVR